MIGFSDAPLQIALWTGLVVSALTALFGAYLVARPAFGGALAAGWEASIFITAFLSGANMITTGLLRLYVGRIFTEVKERPLYVVDEAAGFETAAHEAEFARRLVAE